MSGFFKSLKNAIGLEIEMPAYEVIRSLGDNLEIRKYPATKWVCTKQTGELEQIKQFQGQMFYKLFNYISGSNDKSQKIAMTSPVTMDYRNNENDPVFTKATSCDMEMRFLVPKEFQKNTPLPTKDAYLKEEPEMIAAVAKFGGYASPDDYIKYRDLLVEKLGDEAKNYDTVNLMTAGYDPPFKPLYRTNEVWLRKIH